MDWFRAQMTDEEIKRELETQQLATAIAQKMKPVDLREQVDAETKDWFNRMGKRFEKARQRRQQERMNRFKQK